MTDKCDFVSFRLDQAAEALKAGDEGSVWLHLVAALSFARMLDLDSSHLDGLAAAVDEIIEQLIGQSLTPNSDGGSAFGSDRYREESRAASNGSGPASRRTSPPAQRCLLPVVLARKVQELKPPPSAREHGCDSGGSSRTMFTSETLRLSYGA